MKNLIILLILGATPLAAFSQQTTQAFLSKMEVDWMNKEIGELNSAYQIVKDGVVQKDALKVTENKTDIIKSVTALASNGRTFYNKIMMDIDRDATRKAAVSDTPKDYYYNKRKADPKNQEIALSDIHIEKYLANLEKMEDIKTELKGSSFAFHPHQTQTQKNLELLEKFIVLARNNNRIIQNNLVIE